MGEIITWKVVSCVSNMNSGILSYSSVDFFFFFISFVQIFINPQFFL